MSADTLTLKNQAGTTTAVIRYPTGATGYPAHNKTFSKHQLSDGSFAYDVPTNQTKRVWNVVIDSEDAGDDLLANLKTLFDLKASLLLDVDIDAYAINETDIAVMFEQFRPIPVVGDVFQYEITLQEI